MKTLVDARLRSEARKYGFRFACEDCAHFEGSELRCSFGYPAAPRREALGRRELELCKSFELG